MEILRTFSPTQPTQTEFVSTSEIATRLEQIPENALNIRQTTLLKLQPDVEKFQDRCKAEGVSLPSSFLIAFFGRATGYADYVRKAKHDWDKSNYILPTARRKALTKGACSIGLGYCLCVSDVLRESWETQIIAACLKKATSKKELRLLCIGPGNFLDVHLIITELWKDQVPKLHIDFLDITFKTPQFRALCNHWNKKAPGFLQATHLPSIEFLLSQTEPYHIGFSMDFEPLEKAYSTAQMQQQQKLLQTLHRIQTMVMDPLMIFTKESSLSVCLDR